MTDRKIGVGLGVMILKEDKILLGLRHGDPAKADSELHGENTWTMPGGKLEFSEEFEDGCVREVFEETGLKIKSDVLKLISVASDKVSDAHFITLGFLCTKFSGEPTVKEPDEITEWRWWPIDKLPDKIFFPSKKVLDNYLNKRLYK